MSELIGFDLFLKRTDKDGLVSFTDHRVWSADLFMEARSNEVTKEGGKASVVRITKAEYIEATKPRKS